MNVWRLSSRWSDSGAYDSSILDVFWKHEVAFIYDEGHGLDRVRRAEGDLLAITDGQRIVGLAKPLTPSLSFYQLKMGLRESDAVRFRGAEDSIRGFRVKLIDISEEGLCHKDRKRFCQIGQSGLIHDLESLWKLAHREKCGKEFSIDASARSLKELIETKEKQPVRIYQIPVYQRPYAWGDQQIERFVGDIVRGIKENEKMFIGTMQLSRKKLLTPRGEYYQEVIDGQQRLTTCVLILRAMQLLDATSVAELPGEIYEFVRSYDWLETRVSNGEQQAMLDEALFSCNIDELSEPNVYAANIRKIRDVLSSYGLEGIDSAVWSYDAKELFEFLTERLQFVVIETAAGLSKTLQIFNTINTAGLDLNGGDLFKIRAYEYFKDQHNKDCFEEISGIYEDIDRNNRELGKEESSIQEILKIYQAVIVAKGAIPIVTIRFGSETFFERFFDSRFGIQHWKNFTAVPQLEDEKTGPGIINLEEINWVINDRYQLIKARKRPDGTLGLETLFAFNVIEWGRYAEYWYLWHVFRHFYHEQPHYHKKSEQFIQALGRLFVLYSVIYGKKVNAMHTFIGNLVRSMPAKSVDDIISSVEEEIGLGSRIFNTDANLREGFESELRGQIALAKTPKNLLCRMLEWFARDDGEKTTDVMDRIFRYEQASYDIEHIQSYNDENQERRQTIWEDWGRHINGLGNLMLLESSINRSIKNKPFPQKLESYSGNGPGTSQLAVPRTIGRDSRGKESWGIQDAKEKQAEDIRKIMGFVFHRTIVTRSGI